MKLGSKIFFALLFGLLALVSSQLNFSRLMGAENQFFTVFQFFGPLAGAFLGPVFGALSVLVSETINFFLAGKELNVINFFRLFPMAFAAYYFGTQKKRDWSLVVPVIAITAFLLHPVGREVWFYAMFWTIPLIARFLFPQNLFSKSLGATFIAHSVGGAIWIYIFPTTAAYWVALIPIVFFERFMFAAGISASYIAMNTLLARIEHFIPQGTITVNKNYDAFRILVLRN